MWMSLYRKYFLMTSSPSLPGPCLTTTERLIEEDESGESGLKFVLMTRRGNKQQVITILPS